MVTHNIAKGLEWGTELMIIEAGRIAYEHAAGVDHAAFSAVYREHVNEGRCMSSLRATRPWLAGAPGGWPSSRPSCARTSSASCAPAT